MTIITQAKVEVRPNMESELLFHVAHFFFSFSFFFFCLSPGIPAVEQTQRSKNITPVRNSGDPFVWVLCLGADIDEKNRT